jgi:hypothetical protein
MVGAVFSTLLSKSGIINENIFKYPAYLAICLNILNIFFISKFFDESLSVENRVSLLYKKTQFKNLLLLLLLLLFTKRLNH